MSIDYLVRGMTTSSLFGKPTSGVLRGSGPCSGLSSAHGVASNVPTRAYMRHVLLYMVGVLRTTTRAPRVELSDVLAVGPSVICGGQGAGTVPDTARDG